MNDVMSLIRSMLWNITHRTGFTDILDILLVAVVIYELLQLTRHTRGSSLLKGLAFFVLVVCVSNLLGFTSLNWLMMTILNNGAIVLVVLFQPELRKALEQMGTSSFFGNKRNKKNLTNKERIIEQIVQTMIDLSARRIGALLVFEQRTGLNDVIETGTQIDSCISAPILENIFEPNTPLHDGAVVIRGERIMAAACIIHTLTESTGVSRSLGTRHRAGIGITENTDAIVLIVSEETGVMSMAQGGQLTRELNAESIRNVLNSIYSSESEFRLIGFLQGLLKGKEERK